MIPNVYWTVDGRPVDVSDWRANSVINGGFDQMEGSITAATARRLPFSVAQGATVTAYLDSGNVMWEGRLSSDPHIQEGVARFGALGHKERLEKEHGRLLYQTRDYSLWQDAGDEPHSIAFMEDNIDAEARRSALFFRIYRDETYASGDVRYVALWVPGAEITRYAGNIVRSSDTAFWDIRIQRFTGPSGARTVVADHGLNTGDPTSLDETIATPEDALLIGLRNLSGVSTTPGQNQTYRFNNLRVNGIASGDTFTIVDVFNDVADRVDLDVGGVAAGLTTNVLPLDWTEGAWSELLDYVAMLGLAWWRVLEDRGSGPYLEAATWDDSRAWTTMQSHHGARLSLAPLEVFNRVVVHYQSVSGIARQVTVDADPDPLAGTGLTNTYEEELADPQANATLATAVADALIGQVAERRFAGSIDLVQARDEAGRDSPLEVLAGDVVTVADWDMGESRAMRIHEVEYRPDGISVGIESEVSVTAMIAGAALDPRRAPKSRRRRRR